MDGPTAGALSALGSALAWAVITIIVRAFSPLSRIVVYFLVIAGVAWRNPV